MDRPTGITILSILAGIAGVLAIVVGLDILGTIAFGPARTGTNLAMTAWASLILGVVWLAVSGALWSLKGWAWAFGVIVAILSIVEAIWIMIAGTNTIGSGVGSLVFPLLVLWYLHRPNVMAAFGATE